MMHTCERFFASHLTDKTETEIAKWLGVDPLTPSQQKQVDEFIEKEEWGTDDSAATAAAATATTCETSSESTNSSSMAEQ